MSNSINDLIEQLKKYDEAYAEGDSLISDKDYDTLYRKAKTLDPGNDYFASVGSDVRGGKETLPYTMGSLDQVHNQNDWSNWVKTYDLNDKDVVVSDKQDGISAMLIYRHGLFEKAYSRGNGMEGADITRHVRNVPSVVKDLTDKLGDEAYIAIRAELIMPVATFEAKYAGTFKNPRNMVAGCFNRTTTDIAILRDIQCITYQVVAYSGVVADIIGFPIVSKAQELLLLKRLGFITTPAATVKADTLNDAVLRVMVEQAKAQSATELDGIVVTINKYDDQDSQRRSRTTLNPEHSIKFKVSAEGVVTEVTDVLWEVSKSGFFKPRVQIRPVNLTGVTITYATGFNGKFINDNGIGPGAKVKITRSGDVIPYITEVISSVTPKMPAEAWDWNDNGVEAITTDMSNPEVLFKQILSFVESLKVDLLKESTLREVFTRLKLADLPYEDIIVTLFELTPGEWTKLVGANGIKVCDSLERRGANMTHELFLGSVNYLGFGFGVRKAKALLAQIAYDDILTASVATLAKLDGFDDTTAKKIANGIGAADNLLKILVAEGFVTVIKEVKTSELTGLNVVFTGFRDPDLEKLIEGAGGKIGSAVSGKTTHLLCVDPTAGSGKLKKAKDLGVQLMTPAQFKDTFNL